MTFAATSGTTAAAPAQASGPGRAAAIAQTFKVDPRAAQLSLGISGGVSLAEYQNLRGIAESRSLDLGIIGLLLAAEGCDGGDPTLPAEDQPQALHTESTDADGGAKKTEQDDKLVAITKEVEAGESFAKATTTTAGIAIPGVIEIGSGTSTTITRIVDGVREAIATTDVSHINVAGVIKLSGLHWEAVHRGDGTVTGSFTVGSGTKTVLSDLGNLLGLAPILENLPLDPIKLIGALNAATQPLGIGIQQPTAHLDAGIMFVDPMKIAIVPSAFRDGIIAKLFPTLQPTFIDLKNKIIAGYCTSADVFTVVDVAINALTGGGSFGIELGGVQATSADIKKSCTLRCADGGGLGGGGNVGGGSNVGSGGGGTNTSGGISSSPRATPSTPTSTATATAPQEAAPAPSQNSIVPTSAKGKRGGAMAGVGLAGLALLGLIAEGDRRKMRNAQRMIPMGA